MKKFFIKSEKISNEEDKRISEEIKQIQEEFEAVKVIQSIIEEYVGFAIPNYVAHDVYYQENYMHLCLMVNLAVVNERLTKNNGTILKQKIKKMCNIKNYGDKCIISI